MKYSVWNNLRGTYSVFESLAPALSTPKRGSNLGAVPTESLDILPPDSQYIGESEIAEGQIVRQPSRLGDFLIIVVAGLAARLIYDYLLRR